MCVPSKIHKNGVAVRSGRLLTLHLTAYYVPQCKQRLLSPQRIFDKENGHVGIFEVTADCARLVIDGSPTLTIPYDPVNSLPTSHGIRASSVCDKEASLNLCVTEETTNQNLLRHKRNIFTRISVLATSAQTPFNFFYVSHHLVHPRKFERLRAALLQNALPVNTGRRTVNPYRHPHPPRHRKKKGE